MKKHNVLIDSACVRCKPNNILISRIHKYLLENDHEINNETREADYIIINTCGFNDFHESFSVDLFKKYNSEKTKNTKVISVGCLNKIDKPLLEEQAPDTIFVDTLNDLDNFFFNKVKFESIQEAHLTEEKINNFYPNTGDQLDLFDKIALIIGKLIAYSPFKRSIKINQILDEGFNKNKVYVEIAQGCLNNCSYCIIKKAKGSIKSRSIDRILEDIEKVYDPNKNLCLVADDCGSYGRDINENIFLLLYAINDKFPQIGIDLNTMHPIWVEKERDEFMKLFKRIKLNSINIPMQSGSQEILKRMNRNYSVENIISAINELREISPETLIWTHLIIGFPGETREDFLKTNSILECFDFTSKFIYSDRKGTPSASMEPKVPQRVKNLRKLRLQGKEIAINMKRALRMGGVG